MPVRTRNPFFIVQDGIRMHLVKALYQVMLVMLNRGDVYEFWRRHPIILFKGPLPPRDFLWLLWKGFMGVQPSYFWTVLGDLEAFLGERQVDAERFFRLFNHGAHGGPPLDPGWTLQAMPLREPREAKAEKGDGLSDPREWLLSGLDRFMPQLFPGCRMERISMAKGSDGAEALFLFHPFPAGDSFAPDFRLFPGLMLNGLPKLFGWSPFAPVEVLADMRSPGRLLGAMERTERGEWSWKGDVLRYRKKTLGRLMRLKDLADGLGEARAIRNALGGGTGGGIGGGINRLVMVAERDVPHPTRDGLLLKEGCAYGSPFTLARIKYASSRRWDRLAERLRGKTPPLPGPAITWESTDILHQELLAFEDPAQGPANQCL